MADKSTWRNAGPNRDPVIQCFISGGTGHYSRIASYYYNTHSKEAFINPPANQNLEDESSLLNQRIQL